MSTEDFEKMLEMSAESDINEYALDWISKDLAKKNILMKAQLGDFVPKNIRDRYSENQTLKDRVNQKISKNYLGFFTLNFSQGIPLPEIEKCIAKVITKKWLTKWWYCYEQRGESIETAGDGVHIHFLFYRGSKRPCACKSEILNSYNHLQGRPLRKVMDNDMLFYPFEFLDDKIAYMSGHKWDEDKQKKIEIDKMFRDKNKLKNLYSSEDLNLEIEL